MEAIRLLVVDDVQVHSYLLQTGMLRINPFMKIDVAASVEEAQRLLAVEAYDAVLCDWVMPRAGGNVLLKWMRARPHFQYVPFIMISAEARTEMIIDAFTELGVDGYVVKPFHPPAVYDKVLAAIEKASARRACAA
ncbi:MAG: response regulator [Pseudomonadota bacterium]